MMTSTRFRHATVAAAGLDILHMTRLKVACSLLMAERVNVDLATWPDAEASLLVVGSEDPQGRVAFEHGRRVGVPVLRIARDTGGDDAVLAHGVTVRELFERLRASLAGDVADGAEVADAPTVDVHSARTMLDQVPFAADVVAILELDARRIAIDRHRGIVHAPTGDTLDAVAEACHRPDWTMTTIARAEFVTRRAAFPVSRSLESWVWDTSIRHALAIGDVSRREPIVLRGWPVPDVETLPVHWLLPVACLLHRPWSLDALAHACGLSPDETARIFAAARHSGLVRTPEPDVLSQAQVKPRSLLPPRGAFARLARRFGLMFGEQRG